MKTLLLIPGAVGAALAAAAALCRMAGLPPHGRDLLIAAIVAVIAAEAALLPALFLRRAEPAQRAQAALGGTVIHLLLTIFMAAAVMVAKVVEPAGPFVYWLTGAYWLTLGMLVWSLIGIARGTQAKPAGN
jgi:hypothetical protein